MAALGSRALLPGLGVFSEAVHGSNASEGGAPLQKKYREVLWRDGRAWRRAGSRGTKSRSKVTRQSPPPPLAAVRAAGRGSTLPGRHPAAPCCAAGPPRRRLPATALQCLGLRQQRVIEIQRRAPRAGECRFLHGRRKNGNLDALGQAPRGRSGDALPRCGGTNGRNRDPAASRGSALKRGGQQLASRYRKIGRGFGGAGHGGRGSTGPGGAGSGGDADSQEGAEESMARQV